MSQESLRRALQGLTNRVVIQPALWRSTEFCVYVLEGKHGPVALLPSELEFYSVEDEIFEADMDLVAFAAKNKVRVRIPLHITNSLIQLLPPWGCY